MPMAKNNPPLPILITGASRGLGAALAMALVARDSSAPIIAVARTTGALEELDDRLRGIGGEAVLAPMDITVPEAMEQLCRSIFDRWGGLQLWVHSAVHAGPLSPAAHLAQKDFDKSMAINVTATARLIGYVSPLLGATGRAVFFDDDVAGKKFFGHYGASKAAQIALVRSWQAETTKIGPVVKILSPRPMPTGTRARFYPGEDQNALAHPREEAARLLPEIFA